ncbi:hypothetical protein MGU_10469 [Metarhizium guizhouense ARSEF 977]|uniref:C2H2-type domain-containing protein n=2 Tax=Metarhizium guizhouense (strain ARSEF 977) TaxID=1276136 RepID=A0A0B4GXH4_METGA|nr:hypothetical protein MGU_10469 [Metarhizium guizhouense ARSEF 977]
MDASQGEPFHHDGLHVQDMYSGLIQDWASGASQPAHVPFQPSTPSMGIQYGGLHHSHWACVPQQMQNDFEQDSGTDGGRFDEPIASGVLVGSSPNYLHGANSNSLLSYGLPPDNNPVAVYNSSTSPASYAPETTDPNRLPPNQASVGSKPKYYLDGMLYCCAFIHPKTLKLCSKPFPHRAAVVSHFDEHLQKLPCPVCDKLLKNIYTFRKHCKLHAEKEILRISGDRCL